VRWDAKREPRRENNRKDYRDKTISRFLSITVNLGVASDSNKGEPDEGCGRREEEAANRVIGAAIEIHREIGAGLLERLYREGVCEELRPPRFDVRALRGWLAPGGNSD
jgi:hypothetical protein